MTLLAHDILWHTILYKIFMVFQMKHISVFYFARYVEKQGEKAGLLFYLEKCILMYPNNRDSKSIQILFNFFFIQRHLSFHWKVDIFMIKNKT